MILMESMFHAMSNAVNVQKKLTRFGSSVVLLSRAGEEVLHDRRKKTYSNTLSSDH